MKKNYKIDIGILTWHYFSNVGSALQAFALHKYIINQGYTCEFINYRKYSNQSVAFRVIRWICSWINNILPGFLPRCFRFEIYSFRKKYFQESPFIKNETELYDLNERYKCFVCGSDQIWAPNILDPIYFLPFVKDEKYKFSYAASIGLNEISPELIPIYKKELEHFDKISVREEQGKVLLGNFLNHKIFTVLDPTFLLTKNEWESIIGERKEDINYIFCYFLGNIEPYFGQIEEYSIREKLKLIRYEPNASSQKKIIKYMGPEEFLRYLKYAELIFTDSFHGTALSIILEKDFWAYKRFGADDPLCQNSRIENILKLCGLEERVRENDNAIENQKINFKTVNIKLSKSKKESEDYLLTCLCEGILN